MYIITGITEEVSKVADPIRQDGRFLSDIKNVAESLWYPISEEMQGIDIELLEGFELSDEDLALLTSDMTSLTIGRVEDGNVTTVYADGVALPV